MKTGQIIKKAILSEKAYSQMETSIYSFMVEEKATKLQIKKAVESQFGTKVNKVRVATLSTKTKKITGTRKSTIIGGGKKAIVFLEKGQSISLLSPIAEKPKNNKKIKENKKDEKKDK